MENHSMATLDPNIFGSLQITVVKTKDYIYRGMGLLRSPHHTGITHTVYHLLQLFCRKNNRDLKWCLFYISFSFPAKCT